MLRQEMFDNKTRSETRSIEACGLAVRRIPWNFGVVLTQDTETLWARMTLKVRLHCQPLNIVYIRTNLIELLSGEVLSQEESAGELFHFCTRSLSE